jgi:competence protein ComEA
VAARVRALLSEPDGAQSGFCAEPRQDVRAVQPDLSPLSPGTVRAGLWQRLAARIPVRLDPGRRAALGVGLAVLVAAIGTGLWLVAERPHSIAIRGGASPATSAGSLLGTAGASVSPSTAGADAALGSRRPPSSPAELLVVDVAGKVRRPGLYRLPPGSRVDDAVRAAGGALPGTSLTSLNLAARVGDGQQIVVGVALPAVGAGASGPSPGTSGAPAGPVSLNSANLDQLETLPGVGPVLAQHILDWRAAHGRFDSVAQLQDVNGIGPAKFAAIKDLVML